MTNNYCPVCKEWMLFPNSHKCNPLWFCGSEPDETETQIYAPDAEQAAEKYAERHDWDWADWSSEQTVYVQSAQEGRNIDSKQKFVVTMEMVPHYHAREEKTK